MFPIGEIPVGKKKNSEKRSDPSIGQHPDPLAYDLAGDIGVGHCTKLAGDRDTDSTQRLCLQSECRVLELCFG